MPAKASSGEESHGAMHHASSGRAHRTATKNATTQNSWVVKRRTCCCKVNVTVSAMPHDW